MNFMRVWGGGGSGMYETNNRDMTSKQRHISIDATSYRRFLRLCVCWDKMGVRRVP